MKAAVFEKQCDVEQKPLKIVQKNKPEPTGREILIKVRLCGICHTDLDEAQGRIELARPDITPGHQVVGIVERTGPSANKFQPGDRVGVTWLYWSCRNCQYCRNGTENLCPNAKWTGKDADGGYAEYMVIEEDFAHELPDVFKDSHAGPLLCAGVIGYRTYRLSQIQNGMKVGIFGFGASAHIVLQVLKHQLDKCRVFVFTRSDEHKQLARELGAEWTGSADDQPPEKVHRVMDFTPVGSAVKKGMDILLPGGRLVINAIRKIDDIPAMNYARYLWNEKQLCSVANVTCKDAADFLEIAAKIPVKPTVEEFEFERVNDALIAMKQSKLRASAVLRISCD